MSSSAIFQTDCLHKWKNPKPTVFVAGVLCNTQLQFVLSSLLQFKVDLVVGSWCKAGLVCFSSPRWSCRRQFSRPSSPMFQGRGFPAAGQEDRAAEWDVLKEELAQALCRGVGNQPCLPILSRLQDVLGGKPPLFLQALMRACGGWPRFQARLLCSSKSILLGSVDEGFGTAHPPFLTIFYYLSQNNCSNSWLWHWECTWIFLKLT